MVQVLEPRESFSANFGQGLGQGIGKGAEFAMQMVGERSKQKERQKLFNQLMGNQQEQAPVNHKKVEKQFLEALPQIEEHLGRDLTPQDLDKLWTHMSGGSNASVIGPQQQQQKEVSDFDRAGAAIAAGEPELGKLFTERGKSAQKAELSRESSAEPVIQKMQSRLEAAEMSDLRQERLQNLFAEGNESQFPPALLAAAFTKDGELNEIALSQLSPDAQESIKLLADEVQGVKDTFGSQITGFEVRRFLARLPSLLNTPEGKRRVIRDLRLMNKINRMHDQGVLDIIDRYGGAGRISVSKANQLYRKENAGKISEWKQEFLNPDKTNFSELPEASMYQGREIEDEETGQVFVSNGKEWVPK